MKVDSDKILKEYRDILKEYHKIYQGNLTSEEIDSWKMFYKNGYFYINGLPGVRKKEIQERINRLSLWIILKRKDVF